MEIPLAELDIILYHGNCPDGTLAAWVFYNKILKDQKRKVRTFPLKRELKPQDVCPKIAGKNVLVLDFCYPIESMRKIKSESKNLYIIDHHKSSSEIVKELGGIYDENRAACQICWDYLHNEERPFYIDYIGNRDLWRKDLKYIEEITSAIERAKIFWNVEKVEEFYRDCSQSKEREDEIFEELKNEGIQIVRENEKFINDATFRSMYGKLVAKTGEEFLVLTTENNSSYLRSEIGNRLSKMNSVTGVGMTWYYDLKNSIWNISLRSNQDSSFKALEIAKKFVGGGGHENAAGFEMRGCSMDQFFFPC